MRCWWRAAREPSVISRSSWPSTPAARVVSTVSGPEKAELARLAGADLVVNYHDEDAVDQVKGFAATVDRVVEVALGPNLDLDLAVSGPRTVISTYAAAEDVSLPVRRLMTANVRLRFVLLYGFPEPDLADAVADVGAAMSSRRAEPAAGAALPALRGGGGARSRGERRRGQGRRRPHRLGP